MDGNSSESVAETDTEHSDLCIMVSDKSTEIKCDSCCEVFEQEQLFKCTTCNNLLESTDTVKFNCDCCILHHLRKGHELLDHKSLKPAVCKAHKNLCSMYCSNCEKILCPNCISNHPNHKVMSIEQRASEVRSKVFELIADMDSCEKSVRSTHDRLNEHEETRTKSYEKLVLDVSSEMDALKKNILDRIKSEHDKMVKVVRDSGNNYERLLQCQSDLRELLCVSDGNMVERFEEKANQVTEVKIRESELKLCHFDGVDYSMSKEITPLAKSFSDDFVGQIQFPKLAFLSGNSFVYSKKCGSLYSVEYKNFEITVHECNFKEHQDGHVEMFKIELATYESDTPICDMQAFFLIQHPSEPTILIKISNLLHLFEVKSKSFRVIKSTLQIYQIPLFFESISKDNFAEFVYWDEVNKIVRQTNKKSVEYKCTSLPHVVNSWHDDTFVHFVNQQIDVIEIETHPPAKVVCSVIKYSVHGVSDISCISHIKRLLIIWSLSTSSLTFFSRSDPESEYQLCCKVPYGSSFNYFPVRPPYGSSFNYFPARPREVSVNLSFLVTAKYQDERGHWVNKNVFMIKVPWLKYLAPQVLDIRKADSRLQLKN